METKKITKATFKSFIKNNLNNLFINVKSSFDGMTDCVESLNGGFSEIIKDDSFKEHSFGIRGLWLVGSSRDYFSYYEDEQFKGIKYYNSCGSGIIAIKK